MSTKRKLENEEVADEGKIGMEMPEPEVVEHNQDKKFKKLYEREPDFRVLAGEDEEFAKYFKNGTIDFTDPDAVLQLTKTLLRRDFSLEITMPPDRLCPMVQNRHNYILWLKSLIDSSLPPGYPQSAITGLDIGTGASCIYPLLGCVQRPWSFIGSDIDETNITFARENVLRNHLSSRISIVHRDPDGSLIHLPALGAPDGLTFCMTNPPFYSCEDDLRTSASVKDKPPATACTGSPIEMVTPGGEVSFALRILADSLNLREQVRWYTIMFGKASSVETLVARLREEKISNYAVAEFLQGSRTRRWAVGWSFCLERPAVEAARGVSSSSWKRWLPAISGVEILSFAAVDTSRLGLVTRKLRMAIESLDLEAYKWDVEGLRWRGSVVENVWGRAYRRRKERERKTGTAVERRGVEVPFGFLVTVEVGMERVGVRCRWVEGREESVFESFLGYLKGALEVKELTRVVQPN